MSGQARRLQVPRVMLKPVDKRVLLIGWDAADWKVLHPLLDAGKMPHLKRLVENGVIANLATLQPVLSPMLWTSIATGKRPFKHGIYGFSEPCPDGTGVQPITNLSRKSKAVWNILNQQGLRSNVVGWWPSHPAEPINGVMVSNHFQRAIGPPEKPWPIAPGTVHPPRLAQTLAEFRVNPNELKGEHLLPFIPGAKRIDQNLDKRLASCAKILAECTSIHGAATWLMENEPWDFMAVYYDAIDHFGHGFMKYHPPRRDHISEEDFHLYRGVVEAGYLYHDMMLGRLLQLAGKGTTVILMSDHGFHPDHLRPKAIPKEPAGPAVEHRNLGIFVACGPGLKKDDHTFGASLLDITPTILSLFDLPIGEDMDGRPLVDIYEATPEVLTIPSWELVEGNSGEHPSDRTLDPVESKEAIDQLVALGYIEEPGEDLSRALHKTQRELDYNLACSYIDAGLHGKATPLLESMYQAEPTEYRFGLQLAACYHALEQYQLLRPLVSSMQRRRLKQAEAAGHRLGEIRKVAEERLTNTKAEGGTGSQQEAALERIEYTEAERLEIRQLIPFAQVQTYTLDYLMSCVLIAEGSYPEAVKLLIKVARSNCDRPSLHLKVGEAYLGLKRWRRANACFRKVLRIDPENPHAFVGLSQAALGQRKNKLAAGQATKAVGLLYHYPRAHYCLGVALHRMGKLFRAVDALEIAITFNPNFEEAHRRLAHLFKKRLDFPEKAKRHLEIAKELRKQSRERRNGRVSSIPEIDERLVNLLPSFTALDELQRPSNTETQLDEESAAPSGEIVIVSGLPRSGTSMMMQMLAAGGCEILADNYRQADEDNPRGYYEFEPAKRLATDSTWLEQGVHKAVKIVAQLLRYLPRKYHYKVIMMNRDLDETLNSQKRMLARNDRSGAALETAKLREVYRQQFRQIRSLLDAREIPVLDITYANVIEHPRQFSATIAAFLGSELDEAAMSNVVDPKLHRQKITSHSPSRR